MLNLTPQERRVILFLTSVALLGLSINFAIKINSRLVMVLRTEQVSKININAVSYEDILNTQSISPKLAKNIMEYRNIHGSFRSIEELKDVKGIGDYRYEKLKELFYIE